MMGCSGSSVKKSLGAVAAVVTVMFLAGPGMAQVGDPFPPETWHHVYDSGYGNDVGYGVALDSKQQVITVGYRVTSNSGESHNAYARKYDIRGNLLCEREVKGPQSANQVSFDDRFYGVAMDSQDNFIATGTISGNWYGAEGYHNAMVLDKYDANCNPVWDDPVIYHEMGFGDSAWQEANSVALDSSDNIFLAGRVFAGWGPNQGDWATWKYDANGTLQAGFPLYYNYSTSYIYADLAYDVAVDSSGNIIVVGVRGVSGCDGCTNNNIDWHVRKYSVSGTVLWEDTYGGGANLYDYAYRVALDSQNNVIVAGYTNKGTDNSAANQNYDWLVIKYAADGVGGAGQRLWTYTYESDTGRSEAAQAVTVDRDDHVIVGGLVRDASGNVNGRLVLLNKETGGEMGARGIAEPAGVVPMRLAYRDGAIAIGGYVYDPSGTNHNIYSALLGGFSGEVGIFSPDTGAVVPTNDDVTVSWGKKTKAETFNLSYSLDGGATWIVIGKNLTGTSTNWHTPTLKKNKNKALLKIVAWGASGNKVGSDKSGPFTVEVLTITDVNGGACSAGQPCPITWRLADAIVPDQLQLSYTLDGGVTWKKEAAIPAPPGSTYDWTAPNVRKDKTCKVKLTFKAAGAAVATATSTKFTIDAP
jgi:hypothetical protein